MNEVEKYINNFSGEIKERLQVMRSIIRELAPNATERICMRMPTYDLNGKWLVHFAGFEKHIGFYPQPDGILSFKDKLAKYKTSKGSVQFPLNESLPDNLIYDIVKYRVKEASQ